jgi:hypothetical protein
MSRYRERIPRDDWPPPKSLFWDSWRAAFARHGITETVAEEASMRLAESPPELLTQHLEALMHMARQVYASKQFLDPPAAASDREIAERMSKECPECGGGGWAYREDLVLADGRRLRRGTLYCLCPYGRFLERNHREKSPDVRRRLLDLRDFPELQTAEWKRWSSFIM